MEQSLSFIFTIFFLTLGPVKTIPAFFGLTREATAKFRQKAALEATLIATGLCLFIGFFGRNVLSKWGVSLDALRLAGGLILLINALKVVTLQPQPPGGKKATADTPLAATKTISISPLAIPVIITPYGVVAILFFMVIAQGNTVWQTQIVSMLFLIMLLNYFGMLLANRIMNVIGLPALRLIGWVFAIMQSALAIDVMLEAGKSLGIVKEIH
jgi:multiple antibiotic resistance protein